MRRAFTLVELMAVLAILACLLAVVFVLNGTDRRDAQVRTAAEQLAAVLARARSLAITGQATYGVAFNIRNAAGSSGEVLNNRDGGHWYRIIGPARGVRYEFQGRIPVAGRNLGTSILRNFPDFVEEVERSWVGEPQVLPPRQVRFLALSDTDEGSRTRGTGAASGGTLWYGSGGETTYPRPWFGWFDPTAKRLWGWGGYDPSRPRSGFWYQGSGSPVVGCRNPATRTYDNDFDWSHTISDHDLNGDGDVVDGGEREAAYPVLTAGEPRPLVNAAWLDACIVFTPSGSARFLEWNRGRRCYESAQAGLTSTTGWLDRNGVSDMAKPGPPGRRWFTNSDDVCAYDHDEVGHFDRHTGGWFITLAPDASDDRVAFPDAAEALRTLTPMYRVFVGSAGVIRVIRVRHQEAAFAGATLWPPAPATWLATANAGTNPVWRDCRLGWLHQPDTAGASDEAKLVPRGTPISDVVNRQMLENRQWWLDP